MMKYFATGETEVVSIYHDIRLSRSLVKPDEIKMEFRFSDEEAEYDSIYLTEDQAVVLGRLLTDHSKIHKVTRFHSDPEIAHANRKLMETLDV